MAIDLYSKIETYPYFDENSIEVENELEQFVQQVEILLTTPEESMLGNPSFGCSLDKFLWMTNANSYDIKQYILKKIQEHITLYTPINYDIEVSFIEGQLFDSILVDLIIDSVPITGFMLNP